MDFQSFRAGRIAVDGIEIAYRTAGSGPPLLLLHGHPQTQFIWHLVAPRLAQRFCVVASDLRGYGDSAKPPTDEHHAAYAKRAMAADQVGLMRALGHERFSVVGHDRGGRVAHRLAVDHAERVERLMLLDIAPTLAMYEATDMAFATAYWHWFFLIQPSPLPETLIGADPEFFLRRLMGGRHGGLEVFAPEAFAEYLRCLRDPRTVHGICEDYRASATIDLEHDRADRAAGVRIRAPLRVLWARHGVIEQRFDALAEWRKVAAGEVSGRPLDCGHYLPEEAPDALADEIETFLGGTV